MVSQDDIIHVTKSSQHTAKEEILVDNIFSDIRLWKILAGICAATALLVSLLHIAWHIQYNRSRGIKECTLRMLVLVPLYATTSVICVFVQDPIWPHILTAVRDFYEAVVLASFVQFLLILLGGPGRGAATALAEKMLLHKPEHTGPLCIWRRLRIPVVYKAGPDFVSYVLVGILQYCVIMLVSLFVRILLWPSLAYLGLLGTYVEKWFDIGLLQIKACSCGWAMYNLLLLGVNLQTCSKTKPIVEEISLELKFLSVKGIVFFTFLQQWGFKVILFKLREPEGNVMRSMSEDSVRDTVQNTLLCFETLLFAFWHFRAYRVDEFNQMAMRMQLDEAMQAVQEIDMSEAGVGYAARRELERAIKEAKECLQHEYDVDFPDYYSGARDLEHGRHGETAIRRSGTSVGDEKIYLQTFTPQQLDGRTVRPVRLVLQDPALRTAETLLDSLPRMQRATSSPGEETCVNACFCNWFCFQSYIRRFLKCFLCDFWFCLFWPKGTVGIFATFNLFDEIRLLRERSEKYRDAIQVLPAADGRKAAGAIDEAQLSRAFDTFDKMGGGEGNGLLESPEELETLANGLWASIDLTELFGNPPDLATPLNKDAFVQKLMSFHSDDVARMSSFQDLAAPLLRGYLEIRSFFF